jgi:hypothetical protein
MFVEAFVPKRLATKNGFHRRPQRKQRDGEAFALKAILPRSMRVRKGSVRALRAIFLGPRERHVAAA